ncbi:MAG: hypothetical protein KUG77_18340 [Nannocystaceae bacterium]|nr:hypothetical protein [Nannocystaceae bacterium]
MRRLSLSLCAALALAHSGCSADASGDTDGTSSSSSTTTSADTSSSGPDLCETFTVDLGDEPCVRFGEHELSDFVEDCGPLTCTPRTEPGDGLLPDALSVTAGCSFEGTIGEDRVGGWAQIVDVERDGQSVLVPFCAVQETSFAGYTVEIAPGPVAAQSFDPAGAISLEDSNPTLRVRPAQPCPEDDCAYALAFSLSEGGFDPSSFVLGGEFVDEEGSATLVQPISASNTMLDSALTDRPWVFSIEINYCIQGGDACSLINPNTDATDAFAAFAVIMRPQQ